MTHPANEGFTDNWAYLKTELTWLDRMLMMALARYRQEKKTVDRFAQSQADKASSHWWKGVISLEGNISYDEHRPSTQIHGNKSPKDGNTNHTGGGQPLPAQPQSPSKLGYQQQLELNIQASKRNGVTLALPWLCDRLKLSLFEKNLILMGLAPEVNRRFARLYRYLQSQDDHLVADLPSVELVLRLLCRNDQEWRRARQQLNPDAALIRHNLVLLLYQSHDPFLNATIRLADELVDCLLAEDPDPNELEALLTANEPPTVTPNHWPATPLLPVDFSNQVSGSPTDPMLAHGDMAAPDITTQLDNSPIEEERPELDESSLGLEPSSDTIIEISNPPDGAEQHPTDSQTDYQPTEGQWAPTWSDLVLPPDLLQALQHLPQRFRLHDTVNQYWPEQSPKFGSIKPGLILLFAGPSGTGKTLTANVLAHDIADSLTCVNLAEIMHVDYLMVMDEIETACPSVVLIKSAEQWLRASTSMPTARLAQFLEQRRQCHTLTIFSLEQVEAIAYDWRQQMDHTFQFPLPDPTNRQVLWQQAFPPKLKLGRTIAWDVLSQIPLSGREIGAIAYDAVVRMVADNAKTLKLQYLIEALQWHHVPSRHIQSLQHAGRPSRSRKAKSTTASTVKSRVQVPPVQNLDPPTPVDYSASPTVAIESSQQPSPLPSSTPPTPSQTNPDLPQNHADTGLSQPLPVEATEHHVDANV